VGADGPPVPEASAAANAVRRFGRTGTGNPGRAQQTKGGGMYIGGGVLALILIILLLIWLF